MEGGGIGFPACITGHMTGGESAWGGVWVDPLTETRKAGGTHPTVMLPYDGGIYICNGMDN